VRRRSFFTAGVLGGLGTLLGAGSVVVGLGPCMITTNKTIMNKSADSFHSLKAMISMATSMTSRESGFCSGPDCAVVSC
jgi:hypothetical protein